jgi:uncharacterized glyoxalase superfamily protein PhnB
MTRFACLPLILGLSFVAGAGMRAAAERVAGPWDSRRQGPNILRQEKKMTETKMVSLAPVLFVDEIEPCLAFWEKLGFARTAEVPEGARLGFVMLVKDGVTIMYQTRDSVAKDVPAMAKDPSHSHLFVTVTGLDAILPRLAGAPVAIPERKTFYGAREIGVREPGGNVVTFAEFENRQN